jgi:hypothetical protein
MLPEESHVVDFRGAAFHTRRANGHTWNREPKGIGLFCEEPHDRLRRHMTFMI